MRQVIASCIRQSVFTARFFASATIISIAVFLSSIDTVMAAVRSSEPLEYCFHGKFVLNALSGDTINICIPIVCSIPFSASYIDDVKTNFLKLYIFRTGNRRYTLGKAAGCLVSGGVVIVLGLWLAYGVSTVLFIPLEEPLDPDTADPEYAMTLFQNCGLIFLSGSFWSLFGLTTSAFMESRYIAYAAPFIFYYVLVILCERYFTSLYVIYPKAWLSPDDEWAMGNWGPTLVILELIIATILCFAVAVRKKVRTL